MNIDVVAKTNMSVGYENSISFRYKIKFIY